MLRLSALAPARGPIVGIVLASVSLVISSAPAAAQGAPSPATSPAPLAAPATAGSAISGVVLSADGHPLSGVNLDLAGATRAAVKTDGSGAFTFPNLAPGLYTLTVSKPGYTTYSRDDVTVVQGQPVTLRVSLTASSFSSLRQIGSVSVRSGSTATLNTSTAAVSDISAQTFQDQGQQQVMRVLNETPGIITTYSPYQGGSNGAVASTPQAPQIRGALPYETASLVDGHPVSVGATGTFTPLYLNPYLLQNVEVVKGPGAIAPDINYAIGGSVNYRTLEPTLKPQKSIDFGSDSYGGKTANFRATGTRGKLGYAFDYVDGGTPGPLQGNSWYGSSGNLFGAPTLNGQLMCGSFSKTGAGLTNPCPAGFPYSIPPGPSNVVGSYTINNPLLFCCTTTTSTYTDRAELAKLRYAFSTQTSLTVSYLGAQALSDWNGQIGYFDNTDFFTPPSGYSGSVAAGTAVPSVDKMYYPFWDQANQGLFQSEFRTTFGTNTVLARYYTGAADRKVYNFPFGTTYSYTAQAYGGAYLGNSTTPTYYNGQQVTVQEPGIAQYTLTQDHFRGYSAELDHPAGNNVYSLSFDRNTHDSYAYDGFDWAQGGLSGPTIPAGSSETFQTLMARGMFQLTSKLQAVFSNYLIQYTVHYTPDGGSTFKDATHNFYGPRLGLTWRTSPDISWRASLGSSIAPPYISLVTIPNIPPQGNNHGAATLYTEQTSSGDVKPETSFGWDLGIDKRFHKQDIVVSSDLYQTVLRNQFLQSTQQVGFYDPTQGENAGRNEPLFDTRTENLGHSMYEGIEVSVKRVVPRGFGFTANGTLMRAYAYDLPAGFYGSGALGVCRTCEGPMV